jgi:uncharacterized BrkB/YihY/UPF0761 family membrane protein
MTLALAPPLWYSWAGLTAAVVLSALALVVTVRHDPARATRVIPCALHLAWCLLYWVPNTLRLLHWVTPGTYASFAAWMAGPVFLAGPWGMWPVILLIGIGGRLQAHRALFGQDAAQ